MPHFRDMHRETGIRQKRFEHESGEVVSDDFRVAVDTRFGLYVAAFGVKIIEECLCFRL